MMRSRRAWPALLLPLFCLLAGILPMQMAQAAVTCTASMTDVGFGAVDLVAGVGLSASGTLNYTCTNDTTTATYVRACFNVGDGNESLGFFNPRRMKSGTNALQFQIYQSNGSTIWGSDGNGTVPSPFTFSALIPRRTSTSVPSTISGSTTMQGKILTGQGAAPPGAYQDFFSDAGGHTSLTITTSTATAPSACSTSTGDTFSFTATSTSTSVGNGKTGSGNGTAQSITVYATTTSANFTPDSYADTVTVMVNC